MGIQKYRADRAGETMPNGAIPYYANWMYGPSLALIRNCPLENLAGDMRRTVYITGEPGTWFSQPAACRLAGCTVRGYVTSDDNGGLAFRQTYY